jgi:NAD(P)-dependent dehydrogenase (short-subunit alcohol dehydrogenase family)
MTSRQVFSLAGKVAVVTGAGSGLGRAISEALFDAGAKVVCADMNAAALDQTVARLKNSKDKVAAVACDVTKPKQVAKMIAVAQQRFKRLDILVNNAGISQKQPGRVHEMAVADWNRVLAVNLQGVFNCSREALRIMVEQQSGKIINIASIWGMVGSSSVKPLPAYNASKGAVVNLTREMGLEYAPLGINVNAICPGFFSTRLANGAYDSPDFVNALSKITPAGRVASANEIKGAAIFLASRASDYMCGQTLVLDGGVLAM